MQYKTKKTFFKIREQFKDSAMALNKTRRDFLILSSVVSQKNNPPFPPQKESPLKLRPRLNKNQCGNFQVAEWCRASASGSVDLGFDS